MELIPQTELLFLPDENAQKLSNAVHSLGLVITQLANFSLQGDRPSENLNAHRGQLLGAFGDVADNFYPYLSLIKPEFNEARLQKEVEGVSRLSAQVSQAYDEAKKVLDAMRAAAATTGASAHTSDFNREAEDHQKSANRWLLATWIAFVATAAAAYKLIGMAPGGEKIDVAQVLQFTAGKIIALVILISATVWCGRIYKASRHLVATYRHRAVALGTFETFIKAATDDATKNAVLLETTRAIFGAPSTGFIDAADASADPTARIFEVVKGIGGGKSGPG